jgi:CHAD domain-containing protein
MVASLERRAARLSGSTRFGEWAPFRYEAIVARYREREASMPTDATSLHELRLAAKKLRYEIELLAAVLPSAVRDEAYPGLVEVQDRLGLVSDQATRVARLEALIAELDESHPRDALADVVATERQALEAARVEFLAWRENGAARK